MTPSAARATLPPSAHKHHSAIRRVGEAIIARHAQIAKTMVAGIVDDVPAYRRVQPGVIEDVVALSTATVELLGQALVDGTQIRHEDVPVVREHAARRVHQGVGLDAFLHAYRAALMRYWDACSEEAARLGISRDAALALARFALDAIDTMTTHAAEAYLREESRVRTQNGSEVRDLVERLIRGQAEGSERRRSGAPGLDPTAQLVTVVGRLEASTLPVGDALHVIRDELEEGMSLGSARPLVAVRQGEIVLLVAASSSAEKIAHLQLSRQRSLDAHGIDARFGVSVPSPGFPGVQQAYREAALSLSYTTSARPIVSLTDLSSLECALIGSDAATRAVIASKGRRLLALSSEELAVAADTVRAFAAADLNVARAATAMHVHPNTVRYRLQRVAATTGHDPTRFEGLLELMCILEVSQNDRHP